jgi:hypothetical protein
MALMLNQIQVYGQKFRAGGIVGFGVQTYLNYYLTSRGFVPPRALVLILSLMMTLDLSLVSVRPPRYRGPVRSCGEKAKCGFWAVGTHHPRVIEDLSAKPAAADRPRLPIHRFPHDEEVAAGT